MPKIVNHEAYKQELVEKAITIFREHGYQGLGMRKIAELMGISKSALYHYFPSKALLFSACTQAVTSFEMFKVKPAQLANWSASERVDKLIVIFQQLEKDFAGELSLLIDYTKMLSTDAIATSADFTLANDHFLDIVAYYVGEKNAQLALCLLYGVLLQRLFDGYRYTFEHIKPQLVAWVDS